MLNKHKAILAITRFRQNNDRFCTNNKMGLILVSANLPATILGLKLFEEF